jgi:hypothetical protein
MHKATPESPAMDAVHAADVAFLVAQTTKCWVK